MNQRYSNLLLAIFTAVVAVTLVILFYDSPLRERVENKLFDIRTRLAPSLVETDQIIQVELSTRRDKGLSPALLVDAIQRVQSFDPAAIVLVLPPQIYDYNNPDLQQVAEIVAGDPRSYIGVFGLKNLQRVPLGLAPARDKLVAADLPRFFRRSVVRSVVVRWPNQIPLMAETVARRAYGDIGPLPPPGDEDTTQIKLNYFRPSQLQSIKIDDVAHSTKSLPVQGRVVLIGHTDFHPWTFRDREATYVNTPWQNDGDDVEGGMPLLTVQAVTIANLVNRAWLKQAPSWLTIIHSLLITAVAIAIWRLSVGFASFLFIGGASLLLLFHAGLFAFAKLYIPLADAILLASLATITGALAKLREEGRLRALKEARAAAHRELAQVQERFLDRFAVELSGINSEVKAGLLRQSRLATGTGTMQQAYTKALGSCEELEDYLLGIRQFAHLETHGNRRIRRQGCDLTEVLGKIIGQFDSRVKENELQVRWPESEQVVVWTDFNLCRQILFNLVSNAIKYSPNGGVITISYEHDGGQVKVHVDDQGPGIQQEFQRRIFEKFYRVKDDYVYKLKGHGLGLYLSRYFAQQIGAELSVQSEPGKGSRFSLALPLARGAR